VDKAPRIAEGELGMTMPQSHDTREVTKYTPQGMQDIGGKCTGRRAALGSKRRMPLSRCGRSHSSLHVSAHRRIGNCIVRLVGL
jgi:hypothetical protein